MATPADRYGSAAAFLAAKWSEVNALPHRRVVRVKATALGRELVGQVGENLG
jgi:hypothetical protein